MKKKILIIILCFLIICFFSICSLVIYSKYFDNTTKVKKKPNIMISYKKEVFSSNHEFISSENNNKYKIILTKKSIQICDMNCRKFNYIKDKDTFILSGNETELDHYLVIRTIEDEEGIIMAEYDKNTENYLVIHFKNN